MLGDKCNPTQKHLVYCSSILHKSYEELQGSVTSLKHFFVSGKVLIVFPLSCHPRIFHTALEMCFSLRLRRPFPLASWDLFYRMLSATAQVAAKLVAEHVTEHKARESAHHPAGPSSGLTWFRCFGNHKPNSPLTHVTSVGSALPFFKRVPMMVHSPDTQLNILQDTTIVNHPMVLPGPFSISHRLPGLCSLDL